MSLVGDYQVSTNKMRSIVNTLSSLQADKLFSENFCVSPLEFNGHTMVEMWHRLTQDVCWPQAFNVCCQVRGRGAAGDLSDHQEVSTAQAEVTGETEARPSGGRQADSGDQPGSHHHTCHLPGSHHHLALHTNLAHS